MWKKASTYILICFGLVVIYIVYYNIRFNSNFLNTELSSIVAVTVAILFAYILTQQRNDERKLKDKVEDIVTRIHSFSVSEDALFHGGSFDQQSVTICHKMISNHISFLENCKLKQTFRKEVKIIRDQFKLYRDFIGDNPRYDYLSQSDVSLRRFLSNIENQCNNIIQTLYK